MKSYLNITFFTATANAIKHEKDKTEQLIAQAYTQLDMPAAFQFAQEGLAFEQFGDFV